MRIGKDGMTYVTKRGSFFIKPSTDRLHRKRPTRFIKLTQALKRWARDLARLSSLTKTNRVRYEGHLLKRNLKEAICVAVVSERVIMQHLLTNLRRRS